MTDLNIKQLHNLSSIEPDPEFRTRTRQLILATPRAVETEKISRVSVFQLLRIPRFALSASALALAILFVGTYSLINSSSRQMSSITALDTKNIAAELADLSIDVKLEQVSYNQKIEETVALAVSEIATRQVQQSAPILSTESNAVPAQLLDRNKDIDSLLQDIIF